MGTLPERSIDAAAVTRLSDADREQAVALLNEAVADGRLTWQEHGERVELVWSARTRDQLVPSVGDLGPVLRRVPAQRVVATASKIVRRPEPGRRIEARSLFGAVYLDLTEVADGEELHVDASSFGGKVVITVGPNARVIDEGTAVLAKRKILVTAPETDGGPVIRITGRSALGHLKVLGRGHRWW
ncbi:MAG TPA: DUF1707 domain-containing protein [Pseudonocardiaceae bacterium]|nr:DUF1707 domain-containing protein [Pseudonocardiaceae bacterium]